jgi:CheY-like chemotaxis protein
VYAHLSSHLVNRFAEASVWPCKCQLQCMNDRILIVDDDDQLINVYHEYLSSLGYSVDCAAEIEEAQTLLTHFPYSVVITDLRLSRLSFGGLDLVRFIRDTSLPPRVVVLTAYGWPELKAEAANQGVDAFLRKPMRLSDLAKTVEILSGGNA